MRIEGRESSDDSERCVVPRFRVGVRRVLRGVTKQQLTG